MGMQLLGFDLVTASLRVMRAAVSRIPKVTIELPAEEEQKLEWLRRSGRDFFQITGPLAGRMAAAYAKGVAKNLLTLSRDPLRPWRDAVDVWAQAIEQRLLTGGGDVRGSMTKLAPSTVKRKGHARIGYDTGDLLNAWLKRRITVR